MRKLTPAYVVTSIVIALTATSALAQAGRTVVSATGTNGSTVTMSNGARSTGSTGTTTGTSATSTGASSTPTWTTFSGISGSVQAPATSSGSSSSSSSSAASGSAVSLSNTTGVDRRDAQNRQATANTRSSGSTSALGTSGANSASGIAGSGTTSGLGATGSSSVNSSGASSANDTGTGNTSTSGASTLGNNGFVTPFVVNGVMGGITADGEFVTDQNQTLGTNRGNTAFGDAGVNAGASVAVGNTAGLNTTANADQLRASQSVDRVIRQAQNDRKRIGRNGQLLQTIAPRTNVDRTDQMPDDGPTPALRGLLPR